MWMALYFGLRPGTEDEVAELFASSGVPNHDVTDDDGVVVGKLLRTLVFVGKEKAVRVIEIDGDLAAVSKHMSRQAEVIELEAKLEPFLSTPRDMVTPEGAMKFFADAGMRCVLERTS